MRCKEKRFPFPFFSARRSNVIITQQATRTLGGDTGEMRQSEAESSGTPSLGWHPLGHKLVLSFFLISPSLLEVGWFQKVRVCQRVAENSGCVILGPERRTFGLCIDGMVQSFMRSLETDVVIREEEVIQLVKKRRCHARGSWGIEVVYIINLSWSAPSQDRFPGAEYDLLCRLGTETR